MIKVEEWNQSVYKGKGIPPWGVGGVPARLAAISAAGGKFSGNKEFNDFSLRNLASENY